MTSLFNRIAAPFFLAGMVLPAVAEAQPVTPPLPLRLKNCQPLDRAAYEANYNRCFNYDPRSEYAQVYVAFHMADFDFERFAQTVDKARRNSVAQLIKRFFVPHTSSGEIFLTLTLLPGDGRPNVPIGTIPLASFSKANDAGIVIKRNSQTRDGFYGPAFLATANTQVMAEVHYTFTDDRTSRAAQILSGVSSYFSGLGLLTGKAMTGDRLKTAFKPVDDLISAQFDAHAEHVNSIQLSFDPSSTMAAYRHLTFNGIATQGGDLFVGLAKLRSVLVNPPEDDGPIVYSSEGYGANATDQILDRRVDGVTLRAHMRTAMAADFEKLANEQDAAQFLQGSQALRRAVSDSDLNLNPNDKLALRWALVAGNSLLKSGDVRERYLLRDDEANLAKLKLDLPPINVELSDAQKLLMDKARAASDRAKGTMDQVNAAILAGSNARNAAALPTPAAGYVRIPPPGTGTPAFTYLGEAPRADQPFNGYLAYDNGGEYTGTFKYSQVPIFEGYGRYAGGTREPGLSFYSGQFANNYFSGSGIMRWRDGREFYGEFAGDKPSGYGLLYYPDGTVYYVLYVAGDATGTAIRKDPSTQKVEAGHWSGEQFQSAK